MVEGNVPSVPYVIIWSLQDESKAPVLCSRLQQIANSEMDALKRLAQKYGLPGIKLQISENGESAESGEHPYTISVITDFKSLQGSETDFRRECANILNVSDLANLSYGQASQNNRYADVTAQQMGAMRIVDTLETSKVRS